MLIFWLLITWFHDAKRRKFRKKCVLLDRICNGFKLEEWVAKNRDPDTFTICWNRFWAREQWDEFVSKMWTEPNMQRAGNWLLVFVYWRLLHIPVFSLASTLPCFEKLIRAKKKPSRKKVGKKALKALPESSLAIWLVTFSMKAFGRTYLLSLVEDEATKSHSSHNFAKYFPHLWMILWPQTVPLLTSRSISIKRGKFVPYGPLKALRL